MKNIHEKTPARKKEGKQKWQDADNKFHGPKTGPHVEHNFVEREEGGWKCTRFVQSFPPNTYAGKGWSGHRAGPRSKPAGQSGRQCSTDGSGSNERRRKKGWDTSRPTIPQSKSLTGAG
eukprot:8876454-Heterocapsa_arctica.AAC.1